MNLLSPFDPLGRVTFLFHQGDPLNYRKTIFEHYKSKGYQIYLYCWPELQQAPMELEISNSLNETLQKANGLFIDEKSNI